MWKRVWQTLALHTKVVVIVTSIAFVGISVVVVGILALFFGWLLPARLLTLPTVIIAVMVSDSSVDRPTSAPY